MLYKNLHRFNPKTLISITYKLHGTSGISSYLLCKRNISKSEKIGAFFHNIYTNITTLGKSKFVITDTEYDYIYASRKVIKNEDINPNANHFYDADIWGLAHDKVKDFLQKGMTFYYEIVGYLPTGSSIQGEFDYGQDANTFGVYIYRITSTNIDGKVIELSAKQVQEFCKANSLQAVPELFYGYASEFADERLTDEHWRTNFLDTIKSKYNEKDCYLCANKVPEEGVVLRIENCIDLQAFKCKSTRFLEWETKKLDKGESNMEDEN